MQSVKTEVKLNDHPSGNSLLTVLTNNLPLQLHLDLFLNFLCIPKCRDVLFPVLWYMAICCMQACPHIRTDDMLRSSRAIEQELKGFRKLSLVQNHPIVYVSEGAR